MPTDQSPTQRHTAKAAYEGYTQGGKAPNGKHFAPFESLPPTVQAAWQTAIDAARDNAVDEPPSVTAAAMDSGHTPRT
jgi:hypothetical protein